MAITLVKQHDKTKGPEQHQTWIFDLTADEPGPNHGPAIFTYNGEKYRAFRTYEQVRPVVKDKQKYPVHRVVAIKCADEKEWMMKGRKGKIAPGVLDGHVAR